MSSFAALLTFVMATSIAAPVHRPPETAKQPVKETIHGVEIVDPYRWLEGSSAPEVGDDKQLDAKVSAWTDEQNAWTRSVLDALPGRDKLEARLRELMEVGSVTAPQMRRNRYFFWKREGSQAQWVIYVQEGHDGKARVLVDPNALDKEGLTAPAWTEPSEDGKLMAFGLYRAGDENTTLHLLDVDSGEWLADEIPGKVEGISWLPDSNGFFYSRLRDVSDPYSRQICFHRIGKHWRHDAVLFEQYREGPLASTWGPFAYASRDARWMIVGYWTGTDSNDLWVVDLNKWRESGKFERRDIVTGAKATFLGPVVGDTLFMQTTLDAPNGRVFAVNLDHPERENWREIIAEKKDEALQGISASRSLLVADYLHNAASHLALFTLDGKPSGSIELPGIGSAGVATEEDRDEAFLTFTSFNEPQSIYRLDLVAHTRELWARPDVPVDPKLVEVKQVFFTSKDGTKVPMFIVHKKGLELDGSNPTLLYGYGGFNLSETPSFLATLFPWFEAGGVYAVANLRGGGEFGEAWHRAGMLEKKQNVFDDFIAAAEWLIANRYTNPKKLAISGGSNGGLLTGAVMVQRPDLFSAAIVAVPLLDMLRYQNFLMAKFWVPEYGSADDPKQFEFIRKYSPYQNVKDGVKYPAVLLTAGENDSRVHPLHARKMAARLQAATSNDPKTKPVLLWVDRSAGHGQGKPLALRIRDVADQRIFLMWQLGMLKSEE